MRQIFLLILFVAIGRWFFKALRRAQQQQGAARAPNGAGGSGRPGHARRPQAAALPEPMVRCAECGVHAPRSASVTAGARSFCSYEHLRVFTARAAADQDRAAR